MGRWGSTEPDEEEIEDVQIDWAAIRRPIKKERIRLTPTKSKPKAIPLAKKRVRLRSDLLSTIRPEQTEERTAATIKAAIKAAIKNNPDISTRELQKEFSTISLVTLYALKIEFRKQLKERGLLKATRSITSSGY
jgi:hypothetical protein